MKLLLLSLALTGCASTQYSGYSSNYTPPVYVKDLNGMTIYRIQDNSIFKPNGERIARIDSNGNVFSPAGVRLATVNKK